MRKLLRTMAKAEMERRGVLQGEPEDDVLAGCHRGLPWLPGQ